jgi:hypothetical protein
MIQVYPKLAEQCLGRDREYAEWYRHMLRTTEPEGVVYADAYWDGEKNPPMNAMRVLGPEGQIEVPVPLPRVAGKASKAHSRVGPNQPLQM